LGVNVANACVALSLLHEAGVDVDMENLKATKDYIEKACTVGAMGYAARIGQNDTQHGLAKTERLAMPLDVQERLASPCVLMESAPSIPCDNRDGKGMGRTCDCAT